MRTDVVDLDFERYVRERRGAAAQRAREGAAYAYTGEHRVRRTLAMARPVTLAIEATGRLWQSRARAEILGSAAKATDVQHPRVHLAAARCAAALHIPAPAVYVRPGTDALTLGTEDDSYIVLGASLVDQLSDEELTFVVGHECGHLHNNHIVLTTALHYLTEAAAFYVRWIVQPAALALRAWARRAEITCDRAGALCCGNIEVASAAITKMAAGTSKPLPLGELFRSHPYLPKRIAALKAFGESAFFRRAANIGPGGTPADQCDAAIAKILSVLS
jgi:Zn-dependent protease with chaperone function